MDTSQSAQLEQASATRRERTGWYFYDWANSAFQTTVITVFLGPFLTTITKLAAGCPLGADTCTGRVHPLGISVAAGSYYPYLVSLSVLLTVFVLPVVGAVADRSPRKKPLLAATAFTGCGRHRGDGLRHRPALPARRGAVPDRQHRLRRLGRRLQLVPAADRRPDERDRVSSRGWAIGYLGGGLLLLINLVAVTVTQRRRRRPAHPRPGPLVHRQRRPVVGRVHPRPARPPARTPRRREQHRAAATSSPTGSGSSATPSTASARTR